MARNRMYVSAPRNSAGRPRRGAGRAVFAAGIGLLMVLVLILQPAAAAAPQASASVGAATMNSSLTRTTVNTAKTASDRAGV